LRQKHARQSAELANLARTLSGKAVDIVSELQYDQTRDGMVRAFRSAQGLVSSAKLSRITSWLRRETNGFRDQFSDAETGRTFVCRDPELTKKLRSALDVATAGFPLPDVPPKPVQIGLREAIGKTYSDAFELAWMLLTGDSNPDRLESLRYSYAGYAPALFVEFLIVALIFFQIRGRRDRGCDWTDEELFGADRRNLPAAVRQRNHRWIRMILASLVEDRRGWFIARPIDGAPDIAEAWLRLALVRKLPVDSEFQSAIPLGELYPKWVEARKDLHGRARLFALHPISKTQLDWLRRAAADLEADLHTAPQSAPSDQSDGKVVGLRSRSHD
jgi:hypothetical protein